MTRNPTAIWKDRFLTQATLPCKKCRFSLQIGELNDYRDGMAGFYLNKDFDHLHIYPGSGTQTSYFYEDNLIPAALMQSFRRMSCVFLWMLMPA